MTTGHDEGQEAPHSTLHSGFPLEPLDGRPLFDLDAWTETRSIGHREPGEGVEASLLARIQELRAENESLRDQNEFILDHDKRLVAEIERLKREIKEWEIRADHTYCEIRVQRKTEELATAMAEIEQMRRHHDLFCRCQTIRYGHA